VEYSENLKRGLLRWYVDGSGLLLLYPYPERGSTILNEAIKKSVYKYPENILQEFSSTPYDFRKDNSSRSLENSIDTVVENDEYIYVDGWAYLSAKNIDKQTTLVVLRSSDRTFAAPTVTTRRPDVAAHYRSRSLNNSGFGALISKRMIPPGRYEVGVYAERCDERGLNFSGKHIEVKK